MITTSAVMDIVTNQNAKAVDSRMFVLCTLVLILLGIYIFIIFPHKSRTIANQKAQIERLEYKNKMLKEKLVTTK